MMKPTLGAIVWFGQKVLTLIESVPAFPPADYAGPKFTVAVEPWAAIVTKVHEDGTVNLRTLSPNNPLQDWHEEKVPQSEALEIGHWMSIP
jgi:hypothetical protein